MAKKIINLTYIVCLIISVICMPLSAIFIIYKLCGATAMSWIACCTPAIIALAIIPIILISKFLIDGREG